LLNERNYAYRFANYGIAVSWYNCMLYRYERVSDWHKNNFSPYAHAYHADNAENQMIGRYHYLQKNFIPLLAYIEEMKNRESTLYGRVELLAIEACAHYKMKDKPAAFKALLEAYKQALPNEIIMPFIELGKDMRALTHAVLHESGCDIPKAWLETIHLKSKTYAKYQKTVISDYEKVNGGSDIKSLSFDEKEVLHDLYKGFSRSEIAVNKKLSVQKVKYIIDNIYEKLNAKTIADVIRIAIERKQV